MDADLAAYLDLTNASDVTGLTGWVAGCKELGFWPDMVCWPLRSTQNYGSGSLSASLGGYSSSPVTLTGTPTWALDGFSAPNNGGWVGSITTPIPLGAAFSMLAVFSHTLTGAGTGVSSLIGDSGAGDNIAVVVNGSRSFTLRSNQLAANMNSTASATKGFFGYLIDSGSQAVVRDATTLSTRSDVMAGGFAANRVFASPALTVITGTVDFSFTCFFPNRKLTTTELQQLRVLYKDTIGTGMSLP